MKIAINLLGQTYNKAGTGWYVNSVLQELAKIDSVNQYILYMPKGYEDSFVVNAENFNVVSVDCPHSTVLRRIYEQFVLPFTILRGKPDVAFSTNNVCPILLGKKNSLLLYDMARWHVNEASNFVVEFFQKVLIYLAAKVAGNIVTISEFSKSEIVNIARVNPEKVHITFAGVRLNDYRVEKSNVLEEMGISGDYIVAIGSTETRKNHVGMIKAFEMANLPIKLVIIGKAGDANEKVVKAIENSSRKADIYLTGYKSQVDSAYIISKALFYITTTLFEGAGMATLEVMSTGKAAIASDLPPIREYCGEAFLPVDPKDVKSIADGINLLYTDINLRTKLEKEGVAQSLKFSWKENAEQLIKIWSEKS